MYPGTATGDHRDEYLDPYSRYRSLLEDFERGPVALNDTSFTLDYQVWYLTWNGDEESPDYGDFTLIPETNGAPVVVLNAPGVTQCGLAFDQNGNPFICYMSNCQAYYWWYDPTIVQTVVVEMDDGVTSVACCVDDHRVGQISQSDIILAYTRGGTLYYRMERERYDTEEVLQASVGAGAIRVIGMNRIYRLQWDGGDGRGARLSQIVGELCGLVGLAANQIDVAELYPYVVRGFKSANLYTAADTIRALQAAYFFDFPQIDGKLVAVPRGGEIVTTISQDDCVVGREVDFETAREQGVEFPLKLHVGYASAETDYNATKETSERRSRDIRSLSETTVETALNLTADDAAQLADKSHRVMWHEFEGKGVFSLPDSFAYLVPSNPILLETRIGTYKRVRITRLQTVDGVLDIEAVVDRAGGYSSTVVGTDPEAPETPAPTIPGTTTWEFMDLPALITEHDTLHYYAAARGDADTAWHGTRIQREVGADWEAETDITSAELMGELEATLPASSAYSIDTTNTVLVSLNRAPASIDTDLMFQGKGAWLIGNEILQVRTWVAEGDNWRGSYLFRGRLDTAPASHSIGARAVFLGNPALVPVDVSLLDTTLSLRAASFGAPGSDATPDDYAFAGNSQEEWPAEMLTAEQSGSDWVLSWIPRYRLGNSANPIPSAHFYGWRLTFTVGMTSVVRDVASTTPAFTWTDAMQTLDFGSAQSSFTLDIQGLSYLGGPGKTLTEAVS
jgi:hypothetical protein